MTPNQVDVAVNLRIPGNGRSRTWFKTTPRIVSTRSCIYPGHSPPNLTTETTWTSKQPHHQQFPKENPQPTTMKLPTLLLLGLTALTHATPVLLQDRAQVSAAQLDDAATKLDALAAKVDTLSASISTPPTSPSPTPPQPNREKLTPPRPNNRHPPQHHRHRKRRPRRRRRARTRRARDRSRRGDGAD